MPHLRKERPLTVLIDGPEALDAGLREVARLDPVLARLIDGGASPSLRKREPGFASLAAIVVSQQVSTASAAAISQRLAAAFPAFTADAILAASDEALRGPGLSGPKVRTLRAIAAAVASGALPLESLHDLPADRAHSVLTAVSGIGAWTADIYLMFCLGHPDAFAAGDLALQEAARIAYALDRRPDPKALARLAERWRPWRAVAAGVLWAFYRQVKSREGVLAGATAPDRIG